MIQFIVFLYQFIGVLYVSIIPLAIILGLFWIIIKMVKGFIRSIAK